MMSPIAAGLIASVDLLCTVTLATPVNVPPVGAVEHLRIDGNSLRWCEGDCFRTRVVRFYEDTISLEHLDVVAGMKTIDTINRRTGQRVFMWTGRPDMERMIAYDCEVKPFSGFPPKKF